MKEERKGRVDSASIKLLRESTFCLALCCACLITPAVIVPLPFFVLRGRAQLHACHRQGQLW